MALRGTLGDFALGDILQLIGLQRKTGLLVLARGEERVALGFDSGRVVSAESAKRPLEQKVGQLLIRTGKLTEARLEEALQIQRQTLQRLGHILTQKRWIDRDTIRKQLMLQVTEAVYDLFRWRDGEYDFQPQTRVEWDRELIEPMPVENLLMEGARMVDEWPMIERVIPHWGVVLQPTRAAAQVLATTSTSKDAKGSVYEQDIDFGFIPVEPLEAPGAAPALSPREARVLQWVDGRRTAGEIAELTEFGSFETFKTLARLMEGKLVETAVTPDASVPDEPGRLATAGPARAVRALVVVLALAGAAGAVQQIAVLLRPEWRGLPSPSAFASATWLARSSGVERLRRTASAARLANIEARLDVYYLDTGRWPRSLSELEAAGQISGGLLVDPWGRPYVYELKGDGYRLAEAAGHDTGEAPLVRERRFRSFERGAAQAPGSVPAPR